MVREDGDGFEQLLHEDSALPVRGRGQPLTVVYDREGNKSFEWVGALTGDILRREIGKVL